MPANFSILALPWRSPPWVNFTNVLRSAFTYVSCEHSFFVPTFLGLYFTGKSLPAQKLCVEHRWNWAYVYSVFHRFRQAKFTHGCSILSSSLFSLLPQQPLKTKLIVKVVKNDLEIIISLLPQQPLKTKLIVKVVKNDLEIIISLLWSKSVKQTPAHSRDSFFFGKISTKQ